jgi:hypothetical protein
MTGLVDVPIDLSTFSWSLSIGNSTLATTRDKGTGDETGTGMSLPVTAFPAADKAALSRMLAPTRRALVLCWDDGSDMGVPIVWGMMGETKTGDDVSFDLTSPLALMGSRIAVREGVFGAGSGSTSTDAISYSGMSLRGILASLGELCTSAKPGGSLPIDWQYVGESGSHERTYPAYDVANLSWQAVATKVANVNGGPDFQFRPVWADSQHVRLSFEAGSDSEPYLAQSGIVPTLTTFAGGGTIEDVEVTNLAPVMRVYGTGSGSDAATICHLSEDLSLCTQVDPWPLIESTASDSDCDSADLVRSHTDAALAAGKVPLVQITGKVSLADVGGITLGQVWPGQMVDVDIRDHPYMPDGTYRMRLMSMAGDQGDMATLTFDQMADPWQDPTVYR